jgi:hypothetical protein
MMARRPARGGGASGARLTAPLGGFLLWFGGITVEDFNRGMVAAVIRSSWLWLLVYFVIAAPGDFAQLSSIPDFGMEHASCRYRVAQEVPPMVGTAATGAQRNVRGDPLSPQLGRRRAAGRGGGGAGGHRLIRWTER